MFLQMPLLFGIRYKMQLHCCFCGFIAKLSVSKQTLHSDLLWLWLEKLLINARERERGRVEEGHEVERGACVLCN